MTEEVSRHHRAGLGGHEGAADNPLTQFNAEPEALDQAGLIRGHVSVEIRPINLWTRTEA